MKNKTHNEKNKRLTHIQSNKTRKFYRLNCSPLSASYKHNKTNNINNSCYNDKQILYFKKIWNLRHKDQKIKSKNTKIIWNTLKNYYINICNRESCWIDKLKIKGKMKNELMENFYPKSPDSWKTNPNEWLSSLDILYVMKLYEKKHADFKFIGPSPIDFDKILLDNNCVWNELCNFNIKTYIIKKINKIGIIFNTDKHYGHGIHWISLFIDIKTQDIYFFDSAGNRPPNEILIFVKRICKHSKKINIQFKFHDNYPLEHQYGGTECGVYSLYFIINMLENNMKFEDFKNPQNILRDEYIEQFRNRYFNKEL